MNPEEQSQKTTLTPNQQQILWMDLMEASSLFATLFAKVKDHSLCTDGNVGHVPIGTAVD